MLKIKIKNYLNQFRYTINYQLNRERVKSAISKLEGFIIVVAK